jgi:hypothetical protein
MEANEESESKRRGAIRLACWSRCRGSGWIDTAEAGSQLCSYLHSTRRRLSLLLLLLLLGGATGLGV